MVQRDKTIKREISKQQTKTKAEAVAEQKRFKRRSRQALFYVLAVVCIVVLTIGELRPENNFPSWSEMFAQLSNEAQDEPEEYANELSGDILMSVHAIDVGQGDCTLVRVGDVTILIDAGENGMGEAVLDYIDELRIEELDYVIGTHPHSDHIGGMDKVMEEIKVGCLIIPEIEESMIPTGTSYADFLEVAFEQKENGMTVDRAEAGKTYKLTKYAEMKILSPNIENTYSDLNDCSVAVLITCDGTAFFSAGDITHTAEMDILYEYPELKADLIKLSHHGSDESNHKSFIEQLDPTYAFISCGLNNSYGHPCEAVLDILSECGTKVRRTDIEGSIVYYTDGKVFIEGK